MTLGPDHCPDIAVINKWVLKTSYLSVLVLVNNYQQFQGEGAGGGEREREIRTACLLSSLGHCYYICFRCWLSQLSQLC